MKRVLAMIMTLLLAVCLVACSSGSAEPAGGDTASTAEASIEEEPTEEYPEIPVTKGEATVDVGNFTVTVPEGWLGAADMSADENDNYYTAPDYYYLIKGGESVDDEFVKPTLSIYYTSEYSAQDLLKENMFPEDENTEFEVMINGKKCPAFHSRMDFSEDGSELVMEYDNIFIPVSDSSCMRVSMLTYITTTGESGISASDKDVVAIMESLKAK